MAGALLICFAFDLGWRGYGWRSHLWLALAFVVVMTIFSVLTSRLTILGMLFSSYIEMAAIFEALFVLPFWGVGLGARRIFGGGNPYSLKFSFDV
ncbi:hypothetical protein [Methylocystis parvus]|uniref:Uncharacterized protein n=1 Tax=Methylocystis parvus TaxID=134 RepID=A0A6B8M563_9HYPH|nr:hypothetical protein [Methylocystis parvus]QGM96473.1 hypothetical protein F7D14_02580 [Methylocystis parvus]WBJ99676.1 hypothetical protein MMG94_17050 [Methylocystis parvus OBBP]